MFSGSTQQIAAVLAPPAKSGIIIPLAGFEWYVEVEAKASLIYDTWLLWTCQRHEKDMEILPRNLYHTVEVSLGLRSTLQIAAVLTRAKSEPPACRL
jgi:hypothetical protein